MPSCWNFKRLCRTEWGILTQVYAMINSPHHSAIIFTVAVGPTMVVIALMFIIRPVGGHKQVRPSDTTSFTFIYSICLLPAAYLMGVMLVEDLLDVNHGVVTIFTIVLFVLILLPIMIPVLLSFCSEPNPLGESLLPETQMQETGVASSSSHEVLLSEVEDESESNNYKQNCFRQLLKVLLGSRGGKGHVEVKASPY